jgi:hypothetical protein
MPPREGPATLTAIAPHEYSGRIWPKKLRSLIVRGLTELLKDVAYKAADLSDAHVLGDQFVADHQSEKASGIAKFFSPNYDVVR